MNTQATETSSASAAAIQTPGGFSIRSKLLLLIAALLFIPWTGYHYIREMERFLLQGQEDALMLTARGIATLLNDRPDLFSPETGIPEVLGESDAQFAVPLRGAIKIDGDSDDWAEYIDADKIYSDDTETKSLIFNYTLAYNQDYLYALFQIEDDIVLYRDVSLRRIDNSDHLRLVFEDEGHQLRRYMFTAREAGQMSVYETDEQWRYSLTGSPVRGFSAIFKPTDDGYNIELRLPRTAVSSLTRFVFYLADVDDDESREVAQIISTVPESKNPQLGRVLLHSPELAKILSALDQPVARIWVLDQQQRVRAVVGQLTTQLGAWRDDENKPPLLRQWVASSLNKIYKRFLESPVVEFEDFSTEVSHRRDKILLEVLEGQPRAQRRPSTDQRAEIIMAAYPIRHQEEILGAIVVEQSSNEIQTYQNEIIQSIATITLFVFLFITTALLIFASRITMRISRLRNTTERAITPEGRVRQDRIPQEAAVGDEIGDLSRSISSMLRRLAQYTRYLEAMPDTLAHELSNPLNVVNSSLDNLTQQNNELTENKYVTRAKNGIDRLRSILTNLTDAANLEEAMQSEDTEPFDLVEVVKSVVEGYRLTYPEREFQLDILSSPLILDGVPDHIAQMLDKLADNAMDFGEANTPIIIRLDRLFDNIRLTVLNEGSPLPATMGDRLFDPMISVGSKNAKKSHLGLGLFVVRIIVEFHQGSVWASNRSDVQGVAVTVSLPAYHQ